jgi:hypothetical protein
MRVLVVLRDGARPPRLGRLGPAVSVEPFPLRVARSRPRLLQQRAVDALAVLALQEDVEEVRALCAEMSDVVVAPA